MDPETKSEFARIAEEVIRHNERLRSLEAGQLQFTEWMKTE